MKAKDGQVESSFSSFWCNCGAHLRPEIERRKSWALLQSPTAVGAPQLQLGNLIQGPRQLLVHENTTFEHPLNVPCGRLHDPGKLTRAPAVREIVPSAEGVKSKVEKGQEGANWTYAITLPQ